MANEIRTDSQDSQEVLGRKSHTGAFVALTAGLVLTLGASGFLWSRANRLSEEVDHLRGENAQQFSKLNAATSAMQEDAQQRLQALQAALHNTNESSSAALKRLRAEAMKQSDELSSKLAETNHQINGELSELKDTTSSKFNEVSTDVNGVKTDVSGVRTDVNGVKEQVATAQTAIEQHGQELRRMVGDMGVMSGLIATNGKDLQHLRDLGERNYIEFTLNKNEKTKKIGDMVLTVKKTDAKRNRYTLEVQADDKRVEKKDRTVNEPVQIYISGNRQPNEIVVNQVGKDEVKGYVALPKIITTAQR